MSSRTGFDYCHSVDIQGVSRVSTPHFLLDRGTLPDRFIDSDDMRPYRGGTELELRRRGGAKTPDDMMVWLPASQVLFSGDVVYVERMLGVVPVSNTWRWLEDFALIEQLNPRIIVPGHGPVTDLATARADPRDSVQALRAHIKKVVDDAPTLALRSRASMPRLTCGCSRGRTAPRRGEPDLS